MSNDLFRIESERICNTYSIHIFKGDEVIFEVCNWNSLSSMHKRECEEFVDYLNNVTCEYERLRGSMENSECILCTEINEDLEKENKRLKQRVAELELLNDGLNYALKYIRKIDVEIDIGDVE